MTQGLHLQINGHEREIDAPATSTLDHIVSKLELRSDRVAIELNGEIVPRTAWQQTTVNTGDRLEIVHFVGGGREEGEP